MIHCGYVGIVGKPNVGKSTLLNKLLGEKLSITSPKPQTTRFTIWGTLTTSEYQIIFLDTPGWIKVTKSGLEAALQEQVKFCLKEADLCLFLVEARLDAADFAFLEYTKKILTNYTKPIILGINKIDTIKKSLLLPVIDRLSKEYNFAEIIPFSALEGDGIDRLLKLIISYLPVIDKPLFSSVKKGVDTLSPLQLHITEIIREKFYHLYSKEIPYSVAVGIDEFKERKKAAKAYLRAIIYVEKPSQKGIVIGNKGRSLKELGKLAREDIEKLIKKSLYLDLWVKVYPKWRKDKHALREFGYI